MELSPESVIPLAKSTTEIIGGLVLYSEHSGLWYIDVSRLVIGATVTATGFVRGVITLGRPESDD